MKISRILAIARKEYIQIRRDWHSLVMALGTPAFLLIIFGYALTLDVDNVPLIVWDQSKTPESRDYIERFVGSRYFSVQGGYADNYKHIIHAIDTRRALAGLIIPIDFSEKIHAGKRADIQLLLDGSDSNTATLALGYAEALTASYSENLLIKELNRYGITPPKPPLDLRSRIWFNANAESKNSIVPGLIAVIMMVLSALMTSLTIAREWERGTMEQLITTPVSVQELYIGKLLPYFLIGLFGVFVVVLMGEYIFHVPFRGSLVFLFVMVTIFLIGALSLGMLISIVTKSQLLASQLAMISTFLPSFLLSGFLSTICNMPIVIQYISYLVPARYFVTLLRAIYLKGVGIETLYVEAGFLTLFSFIMIVLANIKFKKKLL